MPMRRNALLASAALVLLSGPALTQTAAPAEPGYFPQQAGRR